MLTSEPEPPANKENRKPLRVLFVEDNQVDAELSLRELKKAGYDVVADIVQTPEEFAELLHSKSYDIVVSDYNLPNWTGMSALEFLRQQGDDIPFVLVTGSLGEEAAVDCIKKGASDYVLKGQLARLEVAVKRALEEATLRGERKRLEGQFHQAQKMEAIGRLAGGVAHDFNNILGIILGHCQLVAERMDPLDPRTKNIQQIEKAGNRAVELTRQLLTFSRKQLIEPRILDLNAAVAEAASMLKRLVGEDINLKTFLNPEAGAIKADPTQLDQIMMNLAVNARDAMHDGGKLTIETSNVIFDEMYARNHPFVRPGNYVMLAVSDTGCGMDTETQAHIFEPFFTTKEKDKGTGLGLATVYGIVKQNDGFIWVYSEPGHGATFKIYFPRMEEPAEKLKQMNTHVKIVQGTETILHVEDEEELREMASQFLRENGYTVLEAGDGEEALEVASRHPGSIDLLVTDVIMPKMNGRMLGERLQGIHRDMKVLFVSGYTDDVIARHGILEQGTAFLQKPYMLGDLARKIRATLEKRK